MRGEITTAQTYSYKDSQEGYSFRIRKFKENITVETNNSNAEDDLLILANQLSPHFKIDHQSISAWRHQPKQLTYNRFSSMKQTYKQVLEPTSHLLSIRKSSKVKQKGAKQQLKARLKQYQIGLPQNQVIQYTQQRIQKDVWKNVEQIQTNNLTVQSKTSRTINRRTLVLKPFYSKLKNKLESSKRPSSNSVNISKSKSQKKARSNSAKKINTICYPLELPHLNEDLRLKARLKNYLKKDQLKY